MQRTAAARSSGRWFAQLLAWVVITLHGAGAGNVMPDPVTEADCLQCEQGLAEKTDGIDKCKSILQMMSDNSERLLAQYKDDITAAEREISEQELLTAEKRRSLNSARSRLPDAWASRQAATRSAINSMSLEAAGSKLDRAGNLRAVAAKAHNVGGSGGDLAGRWLACDSKTSAVETQLAACAARMDSEKLRLGRREAQRKAVLESKQATAASLKSEQTLLNDAIGKARAEAATAKSHVDELQAIG
eukprot:TRINITY_DN100516_c0_g1_i1.p1 TRINITY_DN100516_c0_g1~~TRINITY_DN100516_c0_g1_i1.p1  ORF type:complete len:246 (-),score=73.67 TRINITY_DN100516_c0_g1_i1:58-795(-)